MTRPKDGLYPTKRKRLTRGPRVSWDFGRPGMARESVGSKRWIVFLLIPRQRIDRKDGWVGRFGENSSNDGATKSQTAREAVGRKEKFRMGKEWNGVSAAGSLFVNVRYVLEVWPYNSRAQRSGWLEDVSSSAHETAVEPRCNAKLMEAIIPEEVFPHGVAPSFSRALFLVMLLSISQSSSVDCVLCIYRAFLLPVDVAAPDMVAVE